MDDEVAFKNEVEIGLNPFLYKFRYLRNLRSKMTFWRALNKINVIRVAYIGDKTEKLAFLLNIPVKVFF